LKRWSLSGRPVRRSPAISGRIERPEIEGELVGTVEGEEVLSIEVLGDCTTAGRVVGPGQLVRGVA
jgi:hypothetical protein